MKISITDLKNLQTVAKSTNKIESIFQSKKNDFRDIEIKLSYSPILYPKTDVYDYWNIEMREEEESKTIFTDGKNLKSVKDIFNAFISQGKGESYLSNYIQPY